MLDHNDVYKKIYDTIEMCQKIHKFTCGTNGTSKSRDLQGAAAPAISDSR
jgi:hypothetical protein